MKSKNPSHIHKLPSGYIFRYTIPKDIRPYLGKTELRYSLKTSKIAVATLKAHKMSRVTQCVIKNIREGGTMIELSQEQIQELLSTWFKKELEEDENLRIIRNPLTEDDQGEEVSYYFQAKSAYTTWLARSDYSKVC